MPAWNAPPPADALRPLTIMHDELLGAEERSIACTQRRGESARESGRSTGQVRFPFVRHRAHQAVAKATLEVAVQHVNHTDDDAVASHTAIIINHGADGEIGPAVIVDMRRRRDASPPWQGFFEGS